MWQLMWREQASAVVQTLFKCIVWKAEKQCRLHLKKFKKQKKRQFRLTVAGDRKKFL